MTRVFHTGDIHLGMSFSNYPAEIQEILQDARYRTLENLVSLANEKNCGLLIIAGDLFHKTGMAKRDLGRVAQTLAEFEGNAVAILPGNHDYISIGQNDLWENLKEFVSDHSLILREKKPYPIAIGEQDVVLWPGPCYGKHSTDNAVNWMEEHESFDEEAIHIGIAHGSLDGVSPDFDKRYFPMESSELNKLGPDLWLLGHTHIQFPEKSGKNDRIFYCGTPEPDGFDCNHVGHAWIFDIDESKNVESVSEKTGTFKFVHGNWEVQSEQDLQDIAKKFIENDHKHSLIKARLSGLLPSDLFDDLKSLREQIAENSFGIYDWDTSEVRREITRTDIDKEFVVESFPHQLLSVLADKEDDLEALQIAYELIQEVRT